MIIDIKDFLRMKIYKKYDFDIVNKKKIEYINNSFSFDIETTSCYKKNDLYITNKELYSLPPKEQREYKKIAFMYIWQFSFFDFEVIGRTWKDFTILIEVLQKYLSLNYYRRLVIYIHNLSYEFQFLRKWFNVKEVFALKERKPIKAILANGIELRCSYLLSGYSLATLAKNLTSHKIKKLVGDLDYSLIRNEKTELNYNEIAYCVNDILIVKYFIDECIQRFGDITKIPLTQTGIVRKYVQNYTLNAKGYYYKIKKMVLDIEQYKQCKRAFQGGFTHGNITKIKRTIENVSSIDFTSSYPFCLLSEKYPMSKGYRIEKQITEQAFYSLLKNNVAIMDVAFYDIKTKYNINIIPIHKCYIKENYQNDNGKLIQADKITMSMTNIDFNDIKKFYSFSHCEIMNVTFYKSEYLPKPFTDCIFKFYNDKTKLKNVNGKEQEYLHAKEMLNSLYGMAVTNIVRNDIEYNADEWESIEPNIENVLQEYNTNKRRFLFYAWGVFCTSYARHNLFSGLYEFKDDYVYCDTDSIKCTNYEKHINYINEYNNNCIKKLNVLCDLYNYDYSIYKPKTNENKEKILGVWDFEGTYKFFKSLGAKRYLYANDFEDFHLVVSGLGKKASDTLKNSSKDLKKVFDNFKEGVYFGRGETGKMTHTYIDDEIEGHILDYKGKKGYYHEKSYIHLEDTDFLLTLQNDFLMLILKYANQIDKKRGL